MFWEQLDLFQEQLEECLELADQEMKGGPKYEGASALHPQRSRGNGAFDSPEYYVVPGLCCFAQS